MWPINFMKHTPAAEELFILAKTEELFILAKMVWFDTCIKELSRIAEGENNFHLDFK